jgi:putative transcriptional regulator
VNRIKELRESLNLKTIDLAKALGCGHSRISNYESGERSPTTKYSHFIVRTFNNLGLDVSFEDVFPPPKDMAA